MATSYDDAVGELYRAPHADFVGERKRLAGELKSAGDKAGATKLGKLPRPPISAWAVNQLWWDARDHFDALFESAEKLRAGDLSAQAEHRDALAKLRARAQTILADAGHAATESTLRRVTTTLSALAATGGFEPDTPGALGADRDPPGFEAVGIIAAPVERPASKAKPAKAEKAEKAEADDEAEDENEDDKENEKRRLAEAAAERRKKEQAEAKRLAELRGVETAIASAKSEVERKQKDLDRLVKAVEQAQAAVDKSQAIVDELEAKLAELVRASEEAE